MKQTTDFLKMKSENEKITMITAYDFPTARLVEQANADMILVGDSLGMVVLGYDSTVPVTLGDMIHHGKAVKRGAPETFIVVDMPFMTYHLSKEDTLKNAARLMQETGAHAVKVEGGGEVIDMIRALTQAGIPVVAHLGLLPQSAGVLGGFKVQAKTAEQGNQLVEDARQCEKAGAFAVVLECIPHEITALVSESIQIPTIGIGAGAEADGQVLVYHDLVGFGDHRLPKFVKQYANASSEMKKGLETYVEEVRNGQFPTLSHSFKLKDEERVALYGGTRS